MILGNTSAAVAVSLGAVVAGVRDGAAGVEARLAAGASRWEALRPVLRDATLLGLTPMLNNMAITGLVSIPGMSALYAVGAVRTVI